MIKLDITTSQLVKYRGEEAIVRHIAQQGQIITLEVGAEGRLVEVGAAELLNDNPDLVYDRYQGDEEIEDDPYGKRGL